MNRIAPLLLLLLSIALPTFCRAAQPSAAASVNAMVAEMKKHPSLDVTFTVWAGGNSSSGSMTVAGSRFTFSTPEMKVWFNGKTQWAYAVDAAEVNITEPTQAELAQTNPLSILGGITKNFKLRRLAGATAGTDRIELIPRQPSADFASAVLTINAATHMPREIVVKDSRGGTTKITISSIKPAKNKPQSFFSFNAAAYPGVEVVDLR